MPFVKQFAALIALALTACTPGPTTPPAPPEPGAHARPALESGHHSEHVTIGEFEAPPEEVWAWFSRGRMMESLETQGPVARPISAEPLSLNWPELGAVRRAQLEDGNYVLEEVVALEPGRSFQYMVWAYTSPAAAQVRYGLGEFRIEPHGEGGSRVTWTYRLRAKAFWAEPFVDGFVRDKFGPFMDNGMARLIAAEQ
jgi:Polyketide cyclase / dehydrase and lipid transport